MKYGKFSGNPITEWLIDEKSGDRDMRLVEKFSYTDPDGRVWDAPKGSIINGASIPRPLWSTVGNPYTDDYRRASVVHDVACGTPGVDRKEADEMFHYACLAGGCGLLQARILYIGVRLGAWSKASLPEAPISKNRLLFRPMMEVRGLEEQFLKSKLDAMSVDVRALPKKATIRELDAIIERHLKV
jgi:hypothetical protein